MDGRGGKINSFCAMYSFRMSFCKVPPSRARPTPRFSAATIYIAQIMAAGLLIVIDVVMSARGRSARSTSMSASDEQATPHSPNSPSASGASVS
jgi:hypothetical protein